MCPVLPELNFRELPSLWMSPTHRVLTSVLVCEQINYFVFCHSFPALQTKLELPPPHHEIYLCRTMWPCIPAVAKATCEVGSQQPCVELGLRNISCLLDMAHVFGAKEVNELTREAAG